MDKIAEDNPDGSQPLPEGVRIVRRVEVTVEREITTVILRRKIEPSDPDSPKKHPRANGSQTLYLHKPNAL
jgi:hypothetical protein